MELLKRKRAGEKISELTETESESEEEDKGAMYDTDSDLKALSEFEDEEKSPDVVRQPKTKPAPRNGAATDDDNYDSEFVVDDDNGPLGMFSNFWTIITLKKC